MLDTRTQKRKRPAMTAAIHRVLSALCRIYRPWRLLGRHRQDRAHFLTRICVSAVFALVFPAHPASAQTQNSPGDSTDLTYAVRSQLVQVHLTVTDGDRPVGGLSLSDFRVSEDGIARRIERLDATPMPLQIALLLDVSESMRGVLQATKAAAVHFVQSLSPGDRVTLVTFNSDLRVTVHETDDFKPILDGIDNASARGVTKLHEALLLALKHLSNLEGRKAVVVFSDGEDTAYGSPLDVVLRAAEVYGFPIYALCAGEGLRNDRLKQVLRKLTQANGGRMFLVDGIADLRTAFMRLATELRSIYVLNYYTQAAMDGGWHSIEIEVKKPRLEVHSRKGFYARSGGSSTVLAVPGQNSQGVVLRMPDSTVRGQPAVGKSDPAVIEEISGTLLPAMALNAAVSPNASPVQEIAPGRLPTFKVESRFVEVPVLVESTDDRELPPLSAGDFRIYEDDLVREIVFFRREVLAGDLPKLRALALRSVQQGGKEAVSLAEPADGGGTVLARYYLVLDDAMTEAGDLNSAKRAAQQILQRFHTPLRPFSLHFTSESAAAAAADESLDEMLRRTDGALSKASHTLASDENIMSIYQAYMVERGDAEATQLAELRMASHLLVRFRNDLGEVQGQDAATPDMVRNNVQHTTRELLAENYARSARTLDAIRAIVNAASANRGDYPRVVILISSGLMVGRGSARADAGSLMDGIVRTASRNGVRIFTLDAAGLKVPKSLGTEARTAFLARNPHLESILDNHARGWRLEKESFLNQLARETGARFYHSTNDLGAAAERVLRTSGQLYYLGYLSPQPADGRFHKIRVTTRLASARLHGRQGYFARSETEAGSPQPLPQNIDWDNALERARQAQQSGNMDELAGALELLLQKYPEDTSYWYNLGIAHSSLGRNDRAVEALRRAYKLDADNRAVGLAFSRALAVAGSFEAGAETLRNMIRSRPGEIELLLQLGRIYEAGGRDREAYRTYRSILDLAAEPALEVYPLLIRTSTRIGREREAQILTEEYLARGGQNLFPIDPLR